MKYGAWSLPSGTAVIATGGRHAVELACGDAHESSPWGKPALNVWSAATVASTALLGTPGAMAVPPTVPRRPPWKRSEEHTSELQSRLHLVCRLLLEKKKKKEHHS